MKTFNCFGLLASYSICFGTRQVRALASSYRLAAVAAALHSLAAAIESL